MELLERLEEALGDRYTVEHELGRGGMATVFLARDLKHDREVAVKVLHDDLASSIGAERFQREIHIAGRLTHPNILPLYDSGRLNGSLYYVMPYVEGESLRTRLDREHQLPIAEAVRITCEIAAALDHAHRQGILHRDIKPENVLLEDGHAVIADFGIARALTDSKDHITYTGISLGTPGYMSPEQASATRDIDGRSDQYSLGCVLYEMLVGAPPFSGPNPQAVMARHALDPVPSMRTVRSTIPQEIEAAVVRALAKSPADRFASMHEFAEALCGAGASTTTTVTFAVPNLLRRKSPIVASIVVIAVLAAASLWLLGDSPQRQVLAGTLDQFDRNRIAILYFDNASGGDSMTPLADGLTESLIQQLDRVSVLDVVTSNGVRQFRNDRESSLDVVATVLRAGTLVTGTVEPIGSRVRVEVRLHDGNSAGTVFKRKAFEVPRTAVLSLRDSIATEVASFLRQQLRTEIQLQAQLRSTNNLDAWSLVQRASALHRDARAAAAAGDTSAMPQLRAADSLLALAEALDTAWVEPAILRATVATTAGEFARRASQAEPWIGRGLAHADRALLREPQNARALAARGTLRYIKLARELASDRVEADRLLAGAEADLNTALNLEPWQATTWNTLSTLYYRKLDLPGAHVAAQRAYEEDAYLSAASDVLWRLFVTSYDLEQAHVAEKWCNEGRRRFPDSDRFAQCPLWLMLMPDVRADPERARMIVQEVLALTPEPQLALKERELRMLEAATLARSGQADSARRMITDARAGSDLDPQKKLLWIEALTRIALGEHDEALQLLKRFLTEFPQHRAGLSRNTWWWRDLKSNPEYQALVSVS